MDSTTYVRRMFLLLACAIVVLGASLFFPFESDALNIQRYKDTISDSAPLAYSNHTLSFRLKTAVAPSGSFELQPPVGFEVVASSSFAARNVELYVNGVPRVASSLLSAHVDRVTITPGSPGFIEYTLNPTTGIPNDAQIEFRIGNHTSNAFGNSVSYSSTTGTTTTVADLKPIRNSSTTGTHRFNMNVVGGNEPAYTQFLIAVIDSIAVGPADTTEEIPPFRYDGAPSGNVGGTTPNVEISLKTDEFAICKYSLNAGVDYNAMTNTFSYTGLIVHSQVVPITLDAINTFYVRCMDDEGNFNIDDYEITFRSLPAPSGDPNTEGDVEGDGTGSGNDGTGTGDGGGGSAGGVDGGGSSSGGSSGGGGSGGGSGGRTGPNTDNQTGGGFELSDAPYRSGDAEVVIRGYAFPGSTVYILVDGNGAESLRAGSDGSFSVTLREIARGVYTFGVYAIGSDNVKSSTFSTSFTVTGGRSSNLSNINIMPSVSVSPNPVNPGQTLTVSGRSIPNAQVTVENENDRSTASKKTFTTMSNGSGVWSLSIDTTGFTSGTYKIRAKSKQLSGLGIETNFSGYTFYGVGQTVTALSADLNTDGRVNLTDFSILLFWWGSNGGNSNPPADINRDGTVSLTDFSIMLFNWTG